jgi:hypothetical protein
MSRAGHAAISGCGDGLRARAGEPGRADRPPERRERARPGARDGDLEGAVGGRVQQGWTLPPARASIANVGQTQLVTLTFTLLAVVAVAWLFRAGHWKRGRLLLVTGGIAVALALLTRRLGLAELVILAVLVLLPALLLPARRPRPDPRRNRPTR